MCPLSRAGVDLANTSSLSTTNCYLCKFVNTGINSTQDINSTIIFNVYKPEVISMCAPMIQEMPIKEKLLNFILVKTMVSPTWLETYESSWVASSLD